MNDALYIAATGIQTQQKMVDTISNNLANASTPGFKKGRVNFRDLVVSSTDNAGVGQTPESSLMRGSGVGVSSIGRNFEPGDLKKTEGALDVAIRGEGFLEVTLGDGSSAYSRGGSLQLNRDGLLSTADGHVLKPSIVIPRDYQAINIGEDGRVLVRANGQSVATEVGRLELVSFARPSGLTPLGNSLYKASDTSGDPMVTRAGDAAVGAIQQGFVEMSNVSMVDEMVNLMMAQRAYGLNVKAMQAADEIAAMANNLRR